MHLLLKTLLVTVIFVGFSLATGTTYAQSFTSPINISNKLYGDSSPQVYGEYVVWTGFDGNDNEIYFYRISTHAIPPINISNNDGNNEWEPQIYKDYVVWVGNTKNDWEIFLASKITFPWPMFLPATIKKSKP